jgi:hypothetical protein
MPRKHELGGPAIEVPLKGTRKILMAHFRRKITKAAMESLMRLSVTRTAKIGPIEIAANMSPCVTAKIAQLLSRPYGTVTVSSIGGLRLPLQYLAKPQVFQAALQRAVAQAKSPARPGAKLAPVPQDDSRYMPRH